MGVYPVRAAYPAAVSSRVLSRRTFGPGAGTRPDDLGLPGLRRPRRHDRAPRHGRRRGAAVPRAAASCEGSTSSTASEQRAARPEAGRQRRARAARDRAGGDPRRRAAGRRGWRASRPAPRCFPIRVAGWQQDARGRVGRSTRAPTSSLAGLERAVDPNDDGDAHDAARIALVGVVEPYAAFADGPEARAAAGALKLDTLVVAPAGNDGPAGSGYGSVAGPGGAPAALTVGAADVRAREQRARLVVRAGLDVLFDRLVPLAGAVPPADAVSLAVGRPRLLSPGAPAAEQAAALELADFFDAARLQPRRRPRRARPLRRRTRPASCAPRRRRAPRPSLVYGAPLPSGALGLDERVPVPVVGPPGRGRAAARRGARRGAERRRLARRRRAPRRCRRAERGGVLVARAGLRRPREARPRRRRRRRRHERARRERRRLARVRRRSTARARRPRSSPVPPPCSRRHARSSRASDLKQALVGSARPAADESVGAQGAGLLDLGAAAASELSASPATLALGRGEPAELALAAAAAGRQPLLAAADDDAGRRAPRVPGRGHDRDGAAAPAAARARRVGPGPRRGDRPAPSGGGPAAEGAIVIRPRGARAVRVPFAVAFAPRRLPLVGGLELSQRRFAPSETKPAVLTLRAGLVRTVGGSDEVHPVARLDLELSTEERLVHRRDRPAPRRPAGPLRVRTDRLRSRRPGARRGPVPRPRHRLSVRVGACRRAGPSCSRSC